MSMDILKLVSDLNQTIAILPYFIDLLRSVNNSGGAKSLRQGEGISQIGRKYRFKAKMLSLVNSK